MCVQDAEQVNEGMDNLGSQVDHSNAQNNNWDNIKNTSSGFENSFPLESICEDSTIGDTRQMLDTFLPGLRSGEWSDIGGRLDMEDTHICIPDLAMNFGYTVHGHETISFYGVFDGHGGKGAAQFVRDLLPRIIVDDSDFPLELEKVITRSFMETDAAFAKSCSVESSLSSGTTALTAMIFGRLKLQESVWGNKKEHRVTLKQNDS